jgi:hypothetical protein
MEKISKVKFLYGYELESFTVRALELTGRDTTAAFAHFGDDAGYFAFLDYLKDQVRFFFFTIIYSITILFRLSTFRSLAKTPHNLETESQLKRPN